MKVFWLILTLSINSAFLPAGPQVVNPIQSVDNKDEKPFELDLGNYVFTNRLLGLELKDDDQDIHFHRIYFEKCNNNTYPQTHNCRLLLIEQGFIPNYQIWLSRISDLSPPLFK